MNGHFARLLAASTAILAGAGTASAHPGHSPTDLTSELSAPLAGPDHALTTASLCVLAALVAARVALHLAGRRQAARVARNARR